MREYKNVTEQELLAAGYKKHRPDSLASDLCVALYQRLGDYIINAELYDFQSLKNCPYRLSFDFEGLFTLANGKTFSITCNDFDSLEEIEQFCADVYKQMNCVPRY